MSLHNISKRVITDMHIFSFTRKFINIQIATIMTIQSFNTLGVISLFLGCIYEC